MFTRGQLVVCIDASPGKLSEHEPLLLGKVYTVASFNPAGAGYPAGVQLLEQMYFESDWLFASRFRLLVNSRLDQFRKLLAPIKESA